MVRPDSLLALQYLPTKFRSVKLNDASAYAAGTGDIYARSAGKSAEELCNCEDESERFMGTSLKLLAIFATFCGRAIDKSVPRIECMK
jgi:hypothetical protein